LGVCSHVCKKPLVYFTTTYDEFIAIPTVITFASRIEVVITTPFIVSWIPTTGPTKALGPILVEIFVVAVQLLL
jgi:hypothetical protein